MRLLYLLLDTIRGAKFHEHPPKFRLILGAKSNLRTYAAACVPLHDFEPKVTDRTEQPRTWTQICAIYRAKATEKILTQKEILIETF